MTSDTIVVPLVQPYCVAGSWPSGWAYLVDFVDLDICCPFFRYRYTHIIFYVTVWWLSTYTCFISILKFGLPCYNLFYLLLNFEIYLSISYLYWFRSKRDFSLKLKVSFDSGISGGKPSSGINCSNLFVYQLSLFLFMSL
jgi:hypothetical protein